jgi:hypothetical protein
MIRWFRLLLCTCVVSVTMLSGCSASSESLIAPSPTAIPTATPTEEVAPLASNGPQPQNMIVVTSPSTKFARSEWAFDLSKTYSNPYYFYDSSDTPAANPPSMDWFGADGVSVDMHLISPSNKAITVPAFWMVDYTRVKDSHLSLAGGEILGAKDNGRWHVRFTPEEVGTYQYYLTAQDASGTGRYPSSGAASFAVGNATGKGFVRTSAEDSRFMAYEDGTPYIPIGAGRQWWTDNVARSFDYEQAFTTFGQNGVNLTRIWDQTDFALGVEGASQPVWIDQHTVYGAAQGVEIQTANVHSGLRAAKPTVGHGWYQRLAVTEPTRPHTLTVWIKTDTLSGGQAQVVVRDGMAFNSGNVLGQIPAVTGTTGWTRYSVTFTPNSPTVAINLLQSAGTGSMYVDDISFGPTDANGNLAYNIVSDPDFERHFFKDNPGNDPNANPLLPRPIGTFMNPWADYEYDKIVESAAANGVEIQACSCSGPWFTWPINIAQSTDADWANPWVLKSWERNFRYRVARWGYSPAILGWELFNEMGHIVPGSHIYAFFQAYSAYQMETDPYNHFRTDSQNSGATSPAFWSSGAANLANYHDYLDHRYPASLTNDEANFIYRFAWCLRTIGVGNNTTGSPLCYDPGMGDGTAWTGPPAPWVWGEIGIGEDGTVGNSGEAGSRFLHNNVWAGLFSPLGVTPIEWWWYQEDAAATNAKFASTKSASAFFAGVDYDGAHFTYLMTPADAAAINYTGETVSASDGAARVYAMRREDKKAAYLWVQTRTHVWSNTATPGAISPTVSIGNLLGTDTYRIEVWNTHTGAVIATTNQSPVNGAIAVALTGLTDDVAVKIESISSTPLPNPAPSPRASSPPPPPLSPAPNPLPSPRHAALRQRE